MRNSNILIMSVTMMDFVTALLILFDPLPLIVARLGIFYKIFSDPAIGAILMLAAVFLAMYGLTLRSPSNKRFFAFLPQALFLLLTTGSAVDFIFLQHYADGVSRAWEFILQDQLPTIALTVGYFFAMLNLKRRTYYGY